MPTGTTARFSAVAPARSRSTFDGSGRSSASGWPVTTPAAAASVAMTSTTIADTPDAGMSPTPSACASIVPSSPLGPGGD